MKQHLSPTAFKPFINGYRHSLLSHALDVSNQHMKTSKDGTLNAIISQFPSSCSTIGYGSGVFGQEGYKPNKSSPQIDLIHIVSNTRDFHQQNLNIHKLHYSGLRYFGIGIIELFQNLGSVKMYFNPFVNIQNYMVKYGVVSQANALRDLVEWNNLYLAGRLHKPIKFIKENPQVQTLNQFNLMNAMAVSLLIAGNSRAQVPIVSERELYEIITSLSYMGDPRMRIGVENPNKVKNIVSKQYLRFSQLYHPIIQYFMDEKILHKSHVTRDEHQLQQIFEIQLNTYKKLKMLEYLPIHFRKKLMEIDSLANLSTSVNLHKHVKRTLRNLVSSPSVVQSLKGVFTAGIYKSVKYMIEKRLKYLRS